MASADTKPTTAKPTEETKAEEPQKPAAIVGEDDEFEDFPVDGAFFALLLTPLYQGTLDSPHSILGPRLFIPLQDE